MKNSRTDKDFHNGFIGLILSVVFLCGCDNSFDPLQENNLYNYSMYGILDLSADTHWVRVMPLRSTVFRDFIPNEAEVTLIRESTGETVELEDSLFRLAQESYVWNFWADATLYPNENYIVKAESPEGEITSATASIPPDFPQPEIYYSDRSNQCFIEIDSIVERLAVAEVTYTFRVVNNPDDTSTVQNYAISYLSRIEELFNGNRQFTVDGLQSVANAYNVSPGSIIELRGELLAVSADSNWYGLDMEGVDIPGTASNVENGLGVLTGIVSKRQALRPNIEGQEHMAFCPPLE